jgi:hypothetical protein
VPDAEVPGAEGAPVENIVPGAGAAAAAATATTHHAPAAGVSAGPCHSRLASFLLPCTLLVRKGCLQVFGPCDCRACAVCRPPAIGGAGKPATGVEAIELSGHATTVTIMDPASKVSRGV